MFVCFYKDMCIVELINCFLIVVRFIYSCDGEIMMSVLYCFFKLELYIIVFNVKLDIVWLCYIYLKY